MIDRNLDKVLEIEVLEYPEAIRRRTSMYLGDLDREDLFEELILESFCHAIDETIEGNCTLIQLTIESKTIELIYDVGMSLRVSKYGIVTADAMLTRLYACHNLKKNIEVGFEYCKHGLSVLNAVCSLCTGQKINRKLAKHYINKRGFMKSNHTYFIKPYESG